MLQRMVIIPPYSSHYGSGLQKDSCIFFGVLAGQNQRLEKSSDTLGSRKMEWKVRSPHFLDQTTSDIMGDENKAAVL